MTGLQILHNMEDRDAAQKMKSATEKVARKTKNDKPDDKEACGRQNGSKDDNLNAVDFALFDDEEDRPIDGNYHMIEGYITW